MSASRAANQNFCQDKLEKLEKYQKNIYFFIQHILSAEGKKVFSSNYSVHYQPV